VDGGGEKVVAAAFQFSFRPAGSADSVGAAAAGGAAAVVGEEEEAAVADLGDSVVVADSVVAVADRAGEGRGLETWSDDET
jgi:hypothetical protein